MDTTKSIDIPKIFLANLTGSLFDKCVKCECNLLENNQAYLIEKALKLYREGYESYSTIFEYAVCLSCADQMRSMLSQESLSNLMSYFQGNNDFLTRRSQLMEDRNYDPLLWLDTCVVSGRKVKTLSECQIYAFCVEDQMVFSEFPYMVSGPVLDEIVELLSAETKDELDGFKDEYVDGPSEFKDLLQSGPKVFI